MLCKDLLSEWTRRAAHPPFCINWGPLSLYFFFCYQGFSFLWIGLIPLGPQESQVNTPIIGWVCARCGSFGVCSLERVGIYMLRTFFLIGIYINYPTCGIFNFSSRLSITKELKEINTSNKFRFVNIEKYGEGQYSRADFMIHPKHPHIWDLNELDRWIECQVFSFFNNINLLNLWAIDEALEA